MAACYSQYSYSSFGERVSHLHHLSNFLDTETSCVVAESWYMKTCCPTSPAPSGTLREESKGVNGTSDERMRRLDLCHMSRVPYYFKGSKKKRPDVLRSKSRHGGVFTTWWEARSYLHKSVCARSSKLCMWNHLLVLQHETLFWCHKPTYLPVILRWGSDPYSCHLSSSCIWFRKAYFPPERSHGYII